MHWSVLMGFGFLFEFIGLAVAACGLFRTWHDNAGGRPFFWAWVGRVSAWVSFKVFHHEPRQHEGHASVTNTITMSASGYATEHLSDDMTSAQKFEAIQTNAIRALTSAVKAHEAVSQEKRDRVAAIFELASQIDNTKTDVTLFARNLVVDGIRPAACGLFMAATGLLLQAAAAAFGGAS